MLPYPVRNSSFAACYMKTTGDESGYWTVEWSTIHGLIVSIANFLILIGSVCTNLSGNWCVITWVYNYRYPI